MPAKQELQEELELLRKQPRENEDLLRAASVKAEEMIALEDQHHALKEEVQRLKRGRRKKSN